MISFIDILQDPRSYHHEVNKISVVETHISWVFLTGEYVYKVKKPVNFGFLDFSQLSQRRHYCELELKYNQYLAADLYLEVVAITAHGIQSVDARESEVIEYAVKMRQFDQDKQFDILQKHGQLTTKHMELLAKCLANFHMSTQVSEEQFGTLEKIREPIDENFRQIQTQDPRLKEKIAHIEHWCQFLFNEQQKHFLLRKQNHLIRACHGDVHLRNIALYKDRIVIFDCIEFNESFRNIDVMSEVAFTMMDLQDHQEPILAYRFLNQYLQDTGDYQGLSVLPYYLVYRAMVRAKVDYLRLQQLQDKDEKNSVQGEFESYLDLAYEYTTKTHPKVIINFGFSASGKSFVSQQLADVLPAIRIRTDIERKRPIEGANTVGYSESQRHHIYVQILEKIEPIIDAGFSVLVDGTFLNYKHRQQFREFCQTRRIPFVILHYTADKDTLMRRIHNRKHLDQPSDADLSVLNNQMQTYDPLTQDEIPFHCRVNTDDPIKLEVIVANITRLSKES